MIKLGIIGSNFVSDWLCESVRRTEGITNHALYSRTAERGSEFANKHGIPHVYTDLEEFFSSDIDAVYIASPNSCHFGQAMAAMDHGKHVLCEKPIATSSRDLNEMIDKAKEKCVILLEAMRPAFDPAFDAVKNALPSLGTIRYARFEYCQYSSRYDKFKNGEIMNAFNPKLGNAALMDIGVYALHTCLKLFGLPYLDGISAKSVMLSNGFEGMGTVLLPYDGFTAEILYSKIADSVQPSVILGENGGMMIDRLSVPAEVTLRLRGKDTEALSFESRESNMDFETEEFVRLIRTGDVNHGHLLHSVNTLAVMDKIRALTGISFE